MAQAIYAFGNFVVDAGARALQRDGSRLAIQEQPLQVLLALLERPGQVVSRDTLRLRLWGTTIFVDFDQSLNSALRRLRLVLGDDSRHPVYVETLPRLGFRFLASVTRLDGLSPDLPLVARESITPVRPTLALRSFVSRTPGRTTLTARQGV